MHAKIWHLSLSLCPCLPQWVVRSSACLKLPPPLHQCRAPHLRPAHSKPQPACLLRGPPGNPWLPGSQHGLWDQGAGSLVPTRCRDAHRNVGSTSRPPSSPAQGTEFSLHTLCLYLAFLPTPHPHPQPTICMCSCRTRACIF